MRSCLRLACPLLALLFTAPAFADDKAEPDKAAKDKKQAADKLVTAGTLTGKVIAWDSSDKVLTLNVKLSIPDGIDQGAANAIQTKQAELLRLQSSPPARNAGEYQNRVNRAATLNREIQQNQAKLYKVKQVDQKFIMTIADNAVVRQLELPPLFDDKGFPIKRSAKEKQELRGTDPRLPGYKAEFDDIKVDETVKVVLARKRDAAPDQGKPDKSEEKDPPIRLDKNFQTTMVVIGPEETKK